jgi:plastocyanin
MARRLLVVGAVALVLAACGGDGGTRPSAAATDAADAATVTIETFTFAPDPITVAAGTTVTFVNGDAIDHTVTAGTRDQPDPGTFDEALPEQGATAEITLGEPGSYDYFCRIHDGPGMTATIVVE